MSNELVIDNEEELKIKKFLIDEAKKYLEGNSMKKVGALVGKSNASVHYDLTRRLHDYDEKLYNEVCDKIEEKKGSIDSPVIYERVLKAYDMLVNKNMIIEEISDVLKTPYFKIYRDLTKRLKEINEIKPNVVTNEMLDNVNAILRKHSQDNLTIKKR